jgi:hypothetical protein
VSVESTGSVHALPKADLFLTSFELAGHHSRVGSVLVPLERRAFALHTRRAPAFLPSPMAGHSPVYTKGTNRSSPATHGTRTSVPPGP